MNELNRQFTALVKLNFGEDVEAEFNNLEESSAPWNAPLAGSHDDVNHVITFAQTEKHIYGFSKLGTNNKQVSMFGSQNATYSMRSIRHYMGKRTYELTNHLGNVLSIISDKVIPHNNGGTPDYWLADIRQATDYSPFGVILRNRDISLTSGTGGVPYRYGYQGSEADDEIKGEGNSYTTFYRMLDPRLGRWFSTDPVFQPHQSPYNSMDNNPICLNDINGDATDPSAGDSRQFKRDMKAVNKEAKHLLKRLERVKKASEKLSNNERRQAERFVRNNGGTINKSTDSYGNKRYAVDQNSAGSDNGGSEIGEITIKPLKRFNSDKWSKIRTERLDIKHDAQVVMNSYETRFVDYVRATTPVLDATAITIGGDYVLMYMNFGPDKGFHFLVTSAEKYGINVGVGANFSGGRFNGSSKDLTLDTYLGDAYEYNAGFRFISATGYVSYKNNGEVNWRGGSIGVGAGPVPFNLGGGKTNTFPPKIPSN